MMAHLFFADREIEALLTPKLAYEAVSAAMAALSDCGEAQPLRQVVSLGIGRLFGVMPGMMPVGRYFGAKLVSVFEDVQQAGRHRHQGVVVLFDGVSGEVICIADAERITRIRTAAASAVATNALARTDARTLGIFGTGAQALQHAIAIAEIRPLEEILIWGRAGDRAAALAATVQSLTGIATRAATGREAGGCDIVCTVTASSRPVLFDDWIADGAHINLIGSSVDGPVEVDTPLVVRSRYFADSRRSVLAQGAEMRAALASGLVDERHLLGEIGEVLLGRVAGRRSPSDVTVYKSLGHVVQDFAAVALLYEHRSTGRTDMAG